MTEERKDPASWEANWMRRDWGLLLRQWKTHVAPDMPIETWAEFEQWNESRDQFWRAVEVIARQEVEMFQAEHK